MHSRITDATGLRQNSRDKRQRTHSVRQATELLFKGRVDLMSELTYHSCIGQRSARDLRMNPLSKDIWPLDSLPRRSPLACRVQRLLLRSCG